jgi:hypothetical protein
MILENLRVRFSCGGCYNSFNYGQTAPDGTVMYDSVCQQLMVYSSSLGWNPINAEAESTGTEQLSDQEIRELRELLTREQERNRIRQENPAVDEAFTVAEALEALVS